MFLSKFSHLVRNVVKSYFRNTSIHGFRYTIETPNRFLKLLWIISIVIAFSICFFLISANLEEAELNPTITSTEETVLDDMPAPAISILAPRKTLYLYSRYRVANSIKACDPKVNISASDSLRPFLEVSKTVSDQVRKTYKPSYTDISKYQKLLQKTPAIKDIYSRFCTIASAMNSSELDTFTERLNAKIDSFLMVNDIKAVLGDEIPDVQDIHAECKKNFGGSGLVMGAMIKQWMQLIAPMAFRDIQGLKCLNRFVKLVFTSIISLYSKLSS